MLFASASYGTRDIVYESLGLSDLESVAPISKPYSKTTIYQNEKVQLI